MNKNSVSVIEIFTSLSQYATTIVYKLYIIQNDCSLIAHSKFSSAIFQVLQYFCTVISTTIVVTNSKNN